MKQEKGMTLGQQIGLWAGVSIASLTVGYGLWRVFLEIPHGALAAVALIAVALLPMALVSGWKLGHLEARGVLTGLGLGINEVSQTAVKVADVKASAVRSTREAQTTFVPSAVLPQLIDVTPHRRDEEVIV